MAQAPPLTPAIRRSLDWLEKRQVLDTEGDWAVARPGLRPGGWAFQYANPHYPDLDDTAVVVMAMHRLDPERYANAIARATTSLTAPSPPRGLVRRR